ncbi:MAG: ribonuclease E/G, partial [Proteobacteria bacterium]|nr:ribonuclease E/G [Pseudomonadota bacterium]
MSKRMLIDAAHAAEVRVALVDQGRLEEFDFETAAKKQIKGNIYLAKITRVEPSLQAAFVEYGGNKQGFLPFAEVHVDYYHIPVSDKERLLASMSGDDEDESHHHQESREPRGEGEGEGSGEAQDEQREGGRERGRRGRRNRGRRDRGERGGEERQAQEGTVSENLENIPEIPASDTPETEAFAKTPEQPEIAEDPQTSAEPQDEHAERPDSDEAHGDHHDALHAEGEEPSHFSGGDKEGKRNKDKDEIDTVGNESFEDMPVRRSNAYRRYKIQEVLRRGQIILVQVIKEERGNKGASLTTYISLAGRYCVYMPNTARQGGVSRRIGSYEDRKRLKETIEELEVAEGSSVIIRTAGVDRKKPEIKRDYEYLRDLWDEVRELTLSSTAPAMVYEEGDLVKRSLRDLYESDVEEILVQGDEAFKSAKKFFKMMMPSHVKKIQEYTDVTPIFEKYQIEGQLGELYENSANLRSGGSIVINPTEALVSIDVNSGRATRERNIEETALKTNMEAAREIARQLRLRDMAGLIVIDFIDMMELRNKRAVERALKEALSKDRARIQLGRISTFGLLEMSRQRLRSSLVEANTVSCPRCTGVGYIRSAESTVVMLLRMIGAEAAKGELKEITIVVPEDSAIYLLNQKRQEIQKIEQSTGTTIYVKPDHKLMGTEYFFEHMGRPQLHRHSGMEQGGRRKRKRRDRDRSRFGGESRPNFREGEQRPGEEASSQQESNEANEN